MLQQPNLNKYEMKNTSKQPNSSRINKPEDSEDEPLPMDYTSKLKSIADLNNQKRGNNSKKRSEPKNQKAEESKGTQILEEEEPEEIQVPISHQINQNKNLEDKKSLTNKNKNYNSNNSNNKSACFNPTNNNFSNNLNENLDVRNVRGLRSDNIKDDFLLGNEEEEDKPMNFRNEVKKYSLHSKAKNTSENIYSPESIDFYNQKKNLDCNLNTDETCENNFNSNYNVNNQNFNLNMNFSEQNNINGKVYTRLPERKKSNEKLATGDNHNINKNRTASQKRFGEEIELVNNFNYNKENNTNNIINSKNDPLRIYNAKQDNYNTAAINNNKNSAPLIKNCILNKNEKNLVNNKKLENTSIKSSNLYDSSVQQKKGDLTPKSIRSNNTDEENETNYKPDNLQGTLGNVILSELEENASVNIGSGDSKKNTTMNDLKNNYIASSQINNKNKNNNYDFNFRNNQLHNDDEILNQTNTATFKKENKEELNEDINNNRKGANNKNLNDQTTNFTEFRKSNNNITNTNSNFSSKGCLAPNKNNNLNTRANNYTNNNSNNMTRSDLNLSQNTTQNNLKTQNSSKKIKNYSQILYNKIKVLTQK